MSVCRPCITRTMQQDCILVHPQLAVALHICCVSYDAPLSISDPLRSVSVSVSMHFLASDVYSAKPVSLPIGD